MAFFGSATIVLVFTTDADYHAFWAGVVQTNLVANGWTYVSQTGDGDPNAVARGSTGTFACFRVYSTSVGAETWYMRLDMGYDANGPKWKFQIGSGVDGSGNLTGQTSTQQTILSNAGLGSGNKTVYMSMAAGRCMLHVGVAANATNQRQIVSVHGGVDGSGAMSTGMTWFMDNQSAGTGCQCIPVTGTVPAKITIFPCTCWNVADTTIGSRILTFHPFLWTETIVTNPIPSVAFGGNSNSTVDTTTTLTLYSATRTYIAGASSTGPQANMKCLWLFD